MAKQRFLNNFTSTFIAAVKDAPSSGTPETELDYGVLRISDGAAGSLINPTDGDYYLLTAFKRSGSVESNIEVMRVTGVNNATPGECRITVQRAQEGTSAKAFVAGDYLSLRITKGTAENFSQPADLATKEPVIAAAASTPTEKYWRGDKTWRDFFTDVRAATLTGLSTATNAVVAATDTLLAAIGKLQAQVSSKFDKTGGMINAASATGPEPHGVTTIFTNFGHGVSGSSVAAVALGSAQGQMAGYSFWPTFTGTVDNVPRRAADIWASFNGGWGTEKLSFGVGRGGEANNTALATVEKLTITSAGEASVALFVNNTVFGYGLGSGGTVVQATSKSTAVTLNKPSGQITMNGAALAAGASVIFCLYNSAATPYDTVVVNGLWEFVDPGNYRIEIARMGAPNQIHIRVTNITAGSLSEALVINFSVIKAAKS